MSTNPWRTFRDRIFEVLILGDIEYAELQSCVMALVWGFWLTFYPVDQGVVDDNNVAAVVTLRQLFPSWVWSLWFLTLGSAHLMALAKRSWDARRTLSFTATLSWLFVAIYLALENYQLISVPTTFFFAMGAAWGYWRLRWSKIGH